MAPGDLSAGDVESIRTGAIGGLTVRQGAWTLPSRLRRSGGESMQAAVLSRCNRARMFVYPRCRSTLLLDPRLRVPLSHQLAACTLLLEGARPVPQPAQVGDLDDRLDPGPEVLHRTNGGDGDPDGPPGLRAEVHGPVGGPVSRRCRPTENVRSLRTTMTMAVVATAVHVELMTRFSRVAPTKRSKPRAACSPIWRATLALPPAPRATMTPRAIPAKITKHPAERANNRKASTAA